MASLAERTLALAGVFQSARLVKDLATSGHADEAAQRSSIASVFRIDAASAEAVYGGVSEVRLGLRELREYGLQGPQRDLDVTRYVVGLLRLERKLARRPAMSAQIREGIERARRDAEEPPAQDPAALEQLAATYRATISTVKPRIIVNGTQVHLAERENVDRIRALLLAGIRSAVLWRQLGGGWIQLLLGRKSLVAEAARMLTSG
jgi:high frequency lysogenization protein